MFEESPKDIALPTDPKSAVVLEEKSAAPEKAIDVPAEAVADAMMIAQAQLIHYLLTENEDDPLYGAPSESTLAQELRTASYAMCRHASVHCIRVLAEKYPEQFSALALVTATEGGSTQQPLNDPVHDFHSCFLAKDTKDVWYMGSPANYRGREATDSLTTVLSSPRLSEVLEQLAEREGGVWPPADFIEETLSKRKAWPETYGLGHTEFIEFRMEASGPEVKEAKNVQDFAEI